jgi:hypothetical protein
MWLIPKKYLMYHRRQNSNPVVPDLSAMFSSIYVGNSESSRAAARQGQGCSVPAGVDRLRRPALEFGTQSQGPKI